MTIETHRSSDVAVPDGAFPTPADAVTHAIEQWVGGLDVAMRGAEYVVDTAGCPNSFWPLPPGVKEWQIPDRNPKVPLPNEDRESYMARRRVAVHTVGFVVRYGLGLGLAPEVALTGIFMIGGRPSMYAEQMVALIKRHGHEHEVVERTTQRCEVKVRERGETDWTHFTFTLEDAERAGYVPGKGPNSGNDKKGNQKYLLDPAAMLYARASSIACKTKFPHVLRGMVTYEEMIDERHTADDAVVTVTDARPPRRVTAAELVGAPAPQQPAAAAVADGADAVQVQGADATVVEGNRFEQPPAAPDEPEPPAAAEQALEDRQWRAINERLREIGVAGMGQGNARMQVLSSIVGRRIEKGSDLNRADGELVIDNLAGEAGHTVVIEAIGPGHGDFLFVGEIGDKLAAANGAVAEPADPVGPDMGGADPNADGDYDPTVEPGWGQDGGDPPQPDADR